MGTRGAAGHCGWRETLQEEEGQVTLKRLWTDGRGKEWGAGGSRGCGTSPRAPLGSQCLPTPLHRQPLDQSGWGPRGPPAPTESYKHPTQSHWGSEKGSSTQATMSSSDYRRPTQTLCSSQPGCHVTVVWSGNSTAASWVLGSKEWVYLLRPMFPL